MKIRSLIFCSVLILINNSCDGQNKKSRSPQNKTEKMENKNSIDQPNEENKISLLKQSMLEYIEIAQPSYTKTDVEECVNILNKYRSDLANSTSKDEGMKIVQNTVEGLNKLNEKCDFELIETSEREQIAEIIISESVKKGYSKADEDITEDWREW